MRNFPYLRDEGSSPRMRGTHGHYYCRFVCAGIIPAYAGNTDKQAQKEYFDRDHPRVCGEHACEDVRHLAALGSSPRMRGTHVQRDVRDAVAGIIPAYAGNTTGPQHRVRQQRDHPRVCGEHPIFPVTADPTAGSSPRMRGTPLSHLLAAHVLGIIPAYAGNTFECDMPIGLNRDHPRVCGEHPLIWLSFGLA